MRQMELNVSFLNYLWTWMILVTCCMGDCPMDYKRLGEKCIYFSTTKEQWREAYFACQDRNSSLFAIKNSRQNNILKKYLGEGFFEPTEWWMGIYYDWKENNWRLSETGKIAKYQPFILVKNKRLAWRCGILDNSLKYRWSATKCTESRRYICERQIDGIDAENDLPTIVSPSSPEYVEHSNYGRHNEKTQPAFTDRRPLIYKTRDAKRPVLHCPKRYKRVRGKCYKFSRDKATWEDAYFNCDSEYNGTLAIIHNRKEDTALRKAAGRFRLKNAERWLGGIYDWEAMSWKWAKNGVVIQHQSYDRENLKWHCLVWNPLINDKWSSDNCIREKHYICQTEATSRKKAPTSKSLHGKHPRVEYHLQLLYNVTQTPLQ